MATSLWHYAENQFDNCTKQSKKRMNKISSNHDAKLSEESSDAEIMELYTRFHPLRDLFSAAYTKSITAHAIYKSKTAHFDNLKLELSGKYIEDWDIQIQVQYRKGTPEYIELLPRGREPFQKGTNDQRIEEVIAFGKRLAAYPTLSAVKTAVDDFSADFSAARTTQQAKEEAISSSSNDLETNRINVAEMMYGNLGVLMDKFRNNPVKIEQFFDLETIRQTGAETNEEYEGTIAGGDSLNIISGGFGEATEFLLTNPGIAKLAYFTAQTADEIFSGTGIILEPGVSMTKSATELGNAGNQFLNVTNLDADNQGNYSVVIL